MTKLIRATATLSIAGLLSPLASFLVEMLLASRFGVSGTVDAFRSSYLIVSFTVIYLGQMLPLIISPVIVKYAGSEQEEEAWRVSFTIANTIGAAALLGALILCFRPGLLIWLVAPGLSAQNSNAPLLLFRCASVASALVAWASGLSGILYGLERFLALAIAQSGSNAVLFACLAATPAKIQPAWVLAAGLVLGGAAVAGLTGAITISAARTRGIRIRSVLRPIIRTNVRPDAGRVLPVLVLAMGNMISNLAANRALSRLPAGSISVYGYAWKLLLIAGIVPNSLAVAVFPAMARESCLQNKEGFRRLTSAAICAIVAMVMPLSAFLFAARFDVVMLLLHRGAMHVEAVSAIANIYGIVLLQQSSGSVLGLLTKESLAGGRLRALFAVSATTVLASLTLTPWAGGRFGAGGVAWATVAISLLCLAIMIRLENAGEALVRWRTLLRVTGQYSALSALIVAEILLLNRCWLSTQAGNTFAGTLFRLCCSGSAAIVTVVVSAKVLSLREIIYLADRITAVGRGFVSPRGRRRSALSIEVEAPPLG